ncbi:HEAT repeat domain-containing protein [Haloarcula argentinensis]|uniref:HEAT repeat domain-containing protein n=1 Tax=Haloarcula argentinensis TaxID=43776 RepID=A0A830FNL8_HALAR|nr:HEAT repeat domain-containing protein [Haloarcula argentinensis]EMA20172.1 phycocyanin alpha phycocyanobilin lyase-like protein [Haloarcula argentinensis DSM 12282]MDS0254545.1 HEAT repeat domain-containing protein [Haloarcula argentinensis]GGM40913.1 phycocyanobilin lyase [Haloarcula argentinensis]
MSLYELERDGKAQELIRLLRESDNERVKTRAAELLGNFEDHDDRRDVVNALVDAAQSDSDAITGAAIDSLDELGDDAITQLIGSMAGVDLEDDAADWVKAKAYMQVLDADVPELRMAAANGLGNLDQADAVPKLAERFEDPDPRVRARAARSAGKIGDSRATTPLESVLSDPKAGVRREAADALGNIGNRQALQALLPLYEDDDERVRRIAVGAFGNFGNDRPVDYLIEALSDDSAAVRRTAVYSLIELLSNVPTDQSHEIRDTVVEKLSNTDDRSVVVPLVEILEESTQAAQRRNTAWMLGRVTSQEERDRVIESLVDALGEDDQMLRQFAATSLAELGDDDNMVERRLLKIVQDDGVDPEVRGQAIFTLGKVGGERSRKTLDKLIDETEHDVVRKKAFSAISKLGGRG